jgi:hypothetical protein
VARSFNGSSSDYIGTSFQLPATGPISFSAWIFFTGSINGTIIGAVTNGGMQFGVLQGPTTSQLFLVSVATTIVYNTGSTFPNNIWVHGVLTLDGSKTGNFYINGVLDSTSPHMTGTSIGGPYNANIGKAGTDYYKGLIADLAVWNVVLTPLEIAALAKGVRPPQIRKPSLVGYWPLQGIQSPEPDLSGYANNGTLTGTASAFGPPLMRASRRRTRAGIVLPAITFRADRMMLARW